MTDRELMQMALDALETICGLKNTNLDIPNVMQELRARLAQPEQEPVAWVSKRTLDRIKDFDGSIYANGGFDDAVPLYTAPPQCEWQALTDEEIHSTNGYEEDRKLYRFARAIEAKLKEKNHG